MWAQPPRFPLALEPEGSTGEAVWPAYEGLTRNEDGSLTLIVGYFNRNEELVEVPVGDDNRMGPAGIDMGQPTHFLPGRNWGVFSITVPADQAEQRADLVAPRPTTSWPRLRSGRIPSTSSTRF